MKRQTVTKKKVVQKNKNRKSSKRRQRYRQLGGFLIHNDFDCAGRGEVNQAAKVAPRVIKTATKRYQCYCNKQD